MDYCSFCLCNQLDSEREIIDGKVVFTYYCENCGRIVNKNGDNADNDMCFDDECYDNDD